jgi:DNA-binding NarL/FixJ family response regulator
MGEPVPVSVIALDPMLETGAATALLGCPDISVVTPGEEARVVVVIVDGVDSGVLDAIRARRSVADRPEVVLVATDLTPAEALHVIAVGARGLLRRRDAGPARLARTVLAAASGDCTVPPDVLDRLLDPQLEAKPVAAELNGSGPGLTDRERTVLRLVAEGHETGEIARKLCYSTRTVTSIVHDITHRFQLRNRAHAVAYALRTGLL